MRAESSHLDASISTGDALRICAAINGEGDLPCRPIAVENPAAHKKTAEKALIPLPPTHLTLDFFANTRRGESDGEAQADCADGVAFGYFTSCKKLKTISKNLAWRSEA